MVKNIYRYPFDWFEGWSMNASDQIVVNSKFTRGVARKVFPTLDRDFGVIYPCVDANINETSTKERLWGGDYKILLSINRFERKKDIGLAIRAYTRLSAEEREGTRLILAGGYDPRVAENVEYHQELLEQVESIGLKAATVKTVPTALGVPYDVKVIFLLSVSEAFKIVLLQNASLLLYTPKNEHFGIVPVEAMKYGLPVLASNTGGPLETIVDGRTGWLRDVDKVGEWVYVIRKVLLSFSDVRKADMSNTAKQRVQQNFTKAIMARRFEEEIEKMVTGKRTAFLRRETVIMAIALVGTFGAALLAVVFRTVFRTDPRSTAFIRVDRSEAKMDGFVMPGMGP